MQPIAETIPAPALQRPSTFYIMKADVFVTSR
jgi:hypothetical protein